MGWGEGIGDGREKGLGWRGIERVSGEGVVGGYGEGWVDMGLGGRVWNGMKGGEGGGVEETQG